MTTREHSGADIRSRRLQRADAVHADVQEVEQAAITARCDRSAADPARAQLLVRDHRVLAGGDRGDDPVGMFERYRDAVPSRRDRSSISYMLERYRRVAAASRSGSVKRSIHARSIARNRRAEPDGGR